MFDDSIADFWKDKMVHLMHRNMVRANAERLSLADAPAAFAAFKAQHPEFPASENVSSSYAAYEISFTQDLKFRLFIQGQIKATILQKQDGEYIKLCDARFPNNPFPEIDAFLKMLPEYLKMLDIQQTEKMKNSRQMKLCRQFAVALLEKLFTGTGIIWELEEENQLFNLKLTKDKDVKTLTFDCSDFAEKIRKAAGEMC